MATIGVILPNYNHGHLLARSLTALLSQTFAADEIIIVDDGSTDHSLDVIARFQNRSPTIKLMSEPANAGVVASLNKALATCSTDIVYAAAADDVARPRLFECAAQAFNDNPDLGVFCAEALVIDDGKARSLRPAVPPLCERSFTPSAFRDWLMVADNLCVGVASLARRKFLVSEGGYDATLGPYCDSFLLRRICLMHGVVFRPEVLGEWHRAVAGLSQALARDVELTKSYVAEARRRIEADTSGLFPPGYGDLFYRRALFNAARTALPDAGLAARLASLPEGKLTDLAKMPVIGSTLVIVALTLALKPMSLMHMTLARAGQMLRTLRDPGRVQTMQAPI
jgi:glycosyltransferase involved in cell wall biosynthesis